MKTKTYFIHNSHLNAVSDAPAWEEQLEISVARFAQTC